MSDNTCRTDSIEIDGEKQRRALGKVYSLLLKLAAQREAAAERNAVEASELMTASGASAAQLGEPEGWSTPCADEPKQLAEHRRWRIPENE